MIPKDRQTFHIEHTLHETQEAYFTRKILSMLQKVKEFKEDMNKHPNEFKEKST